MRVTYIAKDLRVLALAEALHRIRAKQREPFGLGEIVPQLFEPNGRRALTFDIEERYHLPEYPREGVGLACSRRGDQRPDHLEEALWVRPFITHEGSQRFAGVEGHILAICRGTTQVNAARP